MSSGSVQWPIHHVETPRRLFSLPLPCVVMLRDFSLKKHDYSKSHNLTVKKSHKITIYGKGCCCYGPFTLSVNVNAVTMLATALIENNGCLV